MVSLGARGSGRSHAVVKCPTAWVPTFVNGGHECLVVRVWDETSDGLGTPPWDAALNRHVAQRNIHVVAAGEAMHAARLGGEPLLLPAPLAPLTLKVGPLYGEPAQVSVARAAPHEMPWLQLRTGVRGPVPGAGRRRPATSALGAPTASAADPADGRRGDHQEVTATTSRSRSPPATPLPAPGEAHVYRVTASQQGAGVRRLHGRALLG